MECKGVNTQVTSNHWYNLITVPGCGVSVALVRLEVARAGRHIVAFITRKLHALMLGLLTGPDMYSQCEERGLVKEECKEKTSTGMEEMTGME